MSKVIEIAQIPVVLKNPNFFSSLSKNASFLKYFLKEKKNKNYKSAFLLKTSFIRLNLPLYKKKKNIPTKIKKLFPSSYPFLEDLGQIVLRDRRLDRFLQIPQVKKALKKNIVNKDTIKTDIVLGTYYLFINNISQHNGTLFILKIRSRNNNGDFLSMAFRGVFRSILKSNDGIIIHACGLKKANKDFIFIGPSGKGKSTICKLLRDWSILSDETVVIKRHNRLFKAFPTPWNNKDCPRKRLILPPNGHPVKAIFFLEKSNDTRLERISLKEALTKLLYEDTPFHQTGLFDTKEGLTFFTLFCVDLLKHIGAFRLFFKNDASFKDKLIFLLKKEELL